MFSAWRRGPVSVLKVVRKASIFPNPTPRSATANLAAYEILRPAISSRFFHISPAVKQNGVGAAQKQQLLDEAEDQTTTAEAAPVLTKFRELADHRLVHPNIIRAITNDMGHHTMTEVQRLTVRESLRGGDIIAQARTGTGKTLGFLVPLIQRIIERNPELANRSRLPRRPRASDIRSIIISPTRELAEQIAVEAKKLVGDTNIRVHTAVGGSYKSLMLGRMRQHGCHLLVGTPGRLYDILSDPESGVATPDLSSLVLDEADRLLDIGFADAIDDIVRLLPDRDSVDRQTMMFSATMPREVLQLARRSLKSNFQFVQTIHEGEQPTHEKVPQRQVQLKGLENIMPTLLELCKREIDKMTQSGGHFKAIIYFNSTANVKLAANIFDNLPSSSNSRYPKHPLWPVGIFEMHSKLTQRQRTRVSDQFRRAQSAIMFSSDVTARGMDFPKVTHVIQVGLPPNVEQYIHRLGRTGRGDQSGEGWLLVPDIEIREARRVLSRLPIELDTSLAAAEVDMTSDAQLPGPLVNILSQVGEATKRVDDETKSTAYISSIGVIQRFVNGRQIVDCLNQWARFGWGMETPPHLPRALVEKFGLENDPKVGNRSESFRDFDSYGGYGRGRRQNFRSNRGPGNRFNTASDRRGRSSGSDRRIGQYSSRGNGYGSDRKFGQYNSRGDGYGNNRGSSRHGS